MVAVTAHERPQILLMPVEIKYMVIVLIFAYNPTVERFVHDQKTHLVAQVQ